MIKLDVAKAAILCTALWVGPAFADGFRAQNNVMVTPVAGGFQVADGGGFGAGGMWCAAADYASKQLRARSVSRIYVQSAASGRNGATFTTDPAGIAPVATIITGFSVKRPGSTLTVDHALGFCRDYWAGRP